MKTQQEIYPAPAEGSRWASDWWAKVVEQLLSDGEYLIGFIDTDDVATALNISEWAAAGISGDKMLAITKRFHYLLFKDDHVWELLTQAAKETIGGKWLEKDD